METFADILAQNCFSKQDIVQLLESEKENVGQLFAKALQVKKDNVGLSVHLRGLIEYSNICEKNCLYCGLRSKNDKKNIYVLSDQDTESCVRQAMALRYGSVAIQCGERTDKQFIEKICEIILRIKELSDGKLGVTLSCGEQSKDTYAKWKKCGAHRYLLRIETSKAELYYKIHPKDSKHNFENRIRCIDDLTDLGYQTGSGIMVGLPWQTRQDIAEDILWFKEKDLAMVGLGPYIAHPDTPLWKYRNIIEDKEERLFLTLKTIAVTRLLMPKINMVSATANQTIDPNGREKGILAGANVIMPNLSPKATRKNYDIYPDKACVNDRAEDCKTCLDKKMENIGHYILYDQWGDSPAFLAKKTKANDTSLCWQDSSLK